MLEFDEYTFGLERVFNETAYSSAYVEVAGMDVVIQILFAILVVLVLTVPLMYFRFRRGG